MKGPAEQLNVVPNLSEKPIFLKLKVKAYQFSLLNPKLLRFRNEIIYEEFAFKLK
jgi:hypothetical protein